MTVSKVCYAVLTKTPCNCKLGNKKTICPCISLDFFNHALLNCKFSCVNTPWVTPCIGINHYHTLQSSKPMHMYISHSLGLVSCIDFSYHRRVKSNWHSFLLQSHYCNVCCIVHLSLVIPLSHWGLSLNHIKLISRTLKQLTETTFLPPEIE